MFGLKTASLVRAAEAICFVSALLLLGCSGKPSESKLSKPLVFTPYPQPTDSIRTYPISAAFSCGGPALTPSQRAWIERVASSKNYRKTPLRFAAIAGIKTAIVVCVNRALPGGIHRGGHVIGEECQVWFDPVPAKVYAASQAACSPPTPKPVR